MHQYLSYKYSNSSNFRFGELIILSISNVQMHTTCSSCPPDPAQGEFSLAHRSFRARPHQRGSSYLSIHLLAYMVLRIVNKSPIFHLDFHRRRLFLHTLLTVRAGSRKQRGRKIATDTRTALPMMGRKRAWWVAIAIAPLEDQIRLNSMMSTYCHKRRALGMRLVKHVKSVIVTIEIRLWSNLYADEERREGEETKERGCMMIRKNTSVVRK